MEDRDYAHELDRFLVEVFNDILKTEESYLSGSCPDLSVRELHLIEEVCRAVDEGRDNRASAIAAAQRVTAGTLTAAVNQLEAKGYLERVRDSGDKRSVRLQATEKGRRAQRSHAQFHRELVEGAVERLTAEETRVLVRGLSGIAAFIREHHPAS
ncbi:MAG: winged helix DNA-binding protein [Oscillospiraceae bacterium]|nr:winged helix DNA-binding protein [Oscillospiraceae bacterium]